MNLSSLLWAGRLTAMTSYFSILFLLGFLPACIVIYAILPQKSKKYGLLVMSCVFYWLLSGELIKYLFLTVLSMHYFSIWIERIYAERDVLLKNVEKPEKKALKRKYLLKARTVLVFAAILHIGILLKLKYSAFGITNINRLLAAAGSSFSLEIPKYMLPIGISFFTLQAVSYIFDVYRETIKADDNIFRLALWISFFPQIVEGPICRYSQTCEQLWNVKQIEYKNLTFGLQRILYGMMKKMVIADRLNPVIKEVFNNYGEYSGGMIAVAAVCYTIQLYMDFSGTMDAVMGVGQIFGVTMPENFRRPFFSKTISEFWMRWHISLGAWFKDYIFYPVTMSKPMKNLTGAARKKIGNHFGPLLAGAIALFCVWFSNGLWHGAAWSYIFFGMYHFVLILTGNIIAPAVKNINTRFHINSESVAYRFLQMLRTCILVVIGELFFRAEGLRAGMAMFKRMVTDFNFGKMVSGKLLSVQEITVAAAAVIMVFVISIINEKGVNIREGISRRNIIIRWLIWYALILFIIVFGAYGPGYTPVDPIYANF